MENDKLLANLPVPIIYDLLSAVCSSTGNKQTKSGGKFGKHFKDMEKTLFLHERKLVFTSYLCTFVFADIKLIVGLISIICRLL